MKKLMLAMCCLAVVLISSQAFADQPTLSISDIYHQAQSAGISHTIQREVRPLRSILMSSSLLYPLFLATMQKICSQ